MIQERSVLKVADNSGAKIVRCFRVLGGCRKRYAGVGDIVIVSVQKAEPRKAIKKKDVVKALVVRTKKAIHRKDGSYIRFDDNAVVILDEKRESKATRIFGPIPREIRDKGFENVFTLAKEVV
jgi:large subunit ribosomal protein L14